MTERTMTDPQRIEIWQSTVNGPYWLKLPPTAEGRARHLRVQPGRRIEVSPEVRRLNQSSSATGRQDPFSNGTLVPVVLLEDESDFDQLSTPNHISDTELEEMVDLHPNALGARLKAVDSPVVLRRVLAAAEAGNVTAGRMKIIRARLDEVAPPPPPLDGADDGGGTGADDGPKPASLYQMGAQNPAASSG